jgi:trigger factor
MQTTLEHTGQLERRLNVAVPLAQIESEVAKRLKNLAKTVKVPGFRPGHVPMRMIAQQYGPQVRSDVISDAVQRSFNDAVREQNLRVAGYPRIEPRRSDEPSSDALEFSAVFEVYPDVTVGDIASLTIERPQAEVAPADVDRTLEVLRKQRAEWTQVERPAESGDRVVVDFTGRIEGVEFQGGQARDLPMLIGEGRMLPEFEAAVSGLSAGEQRTFSLTFPADYHGKEVAGREASFDLTVKQVSAPVLPQLDDAFARAFGIASGKLDELRAEVESNLKIELRRKIESLVKEQVFAGLRSRAQFALPTSLVDYEIRGLMERMAHDLQQQGMKREDIKLTPDMFREQAESRVALGLLLGELVRAHGLAAKPDQVKALVAETAQTYEQPEAVVRWHYEKPERLNEFESLAVERNVVDWVLARANVVAKPVSFESLMGAPRGS